MELLFSDRFEGLIAFIDNKETVTVRLDENLRPIKIRTHGVGVTLRRAIEIHENSVWPHF